MELFIIVRRNFKMNRKVKWVYFSALEATDFLGD